MPENTILNLLTGYKRTAAFLSAFELGLFNYLKREPVDIDELAKFLKGDRSLLELLLCCLEGEGLVEREEKLWKIGAGFSDYAVNMDNYRDIIMHEKNLFNRWVTPQCIASSVLEGVGCRDFDREGFDSQEKETYFKAMCGRNIDIISFWIKRELMGKKEISCIEIGRSVGALSLSLSKKMADMDITLVIDKEFMGLYNTRMKKDFGSTTPKVYESGLSDYSGKYDLICIYNTIHYYPKNEVIKLLSNLKNTMKEGALICIADLFLKKDDKFNTLVLLDWITHGGTNSLEVGDIVDIFNEAGLKVFKQKNIPEISTDLIFGVMA